MTRVAVVGSVNLDLVVSVDRLPAPGETVLGHDVEYRPGGKGANQAVAATRYGADVGLFAAIGTDGFGDQLRTALAGHGLPTSFITVDETRPSGVALIQVDSRGENSITVAPGANAGLSDDDLAALPAYLEGADWLLVQLEVPLATALGAARVAHRAGVPVATNASPLPSGPTPELTSLLALTDLLIVNETEAQALIGANADKVASPGADWVGTARALLALGPRTAVVTLGPEGAVAVTADAVAHLPAFPVEAVDTTGAGDAFCGALIVELADGAALAEALRRACAAGALATTRVGAQDAAPTRSEVDAMLALDTKASTD
ncbi:ribokinase [Promicromonospora sp. Populi]|uniref:ribokinase n=1 Tax=Promicromonospora sp. Populi TaxID=3239420 RepID=UPI0034E2509F